MKILYLATGGLVRDPFSSNEKIYDMASIKNTIVNGIQEEFPNVEIFFGKEVAIDEKFIPTEEITKIDICLCDLTAGNPSVTYCSGMAEGMGKPVIYFSSNESYLPHGLAHKKIMLYSEASLENDFRNELNKVIKMVSKDPTKSFTSSKKTTQLPKAFISYSHKDKHYFDRLMVHLKPLTKKGLIDVWADTQIKTGDNWEKEIEGALTKSSIAILLISADFLASDFIVDNELPPLLSKAEVKGTRILPVIISPCRFSREPTLSSFQAANPPNEPLSSMNDDKREVIYDQLASDIESTLENA